MADGRNIDSGRDSGRTLNPDLNISDGEITNRSQETSHSITGRPGNQTAIRFKEYRQNRNMESTNNQTEPVSRDLRRSSLPPNVLPIKKRNRPDEERMSADNVNQNPGDEQMLGPGSRRLPPEAHCFYKNLNSSEVSQQDGRLSLTHQEASMIPSCPQMTADTQNSFRKSTLVVFDEQDTQWSMVLTGYNYENRILFTLTGDWRSFVRTHNLRRGDTIWFYKNRDSRVAAGYYYIIRFRKRVVHTLGEEVSLVHETL